MEHKSIPKKIHYIWFGRNPKSELILRCIDSWKRFFPDYEIIEWNEDNYNIDKCAYVREAYDAKKWAFASDYARFDIIWEHGGIYLDTDVEFLKPLPDFLLNQEAFSGYESNGNINPGLIYAAPPGFSITRELMEEYEKMHFVQDGKIVCKTVNMVTTEVLERHEPLKKNTFQVIHGLALYPSGFFCGYDLDVGEYDIQPETISVHHYAGTWAKKTLKMRLQTFFKKAIGIRLYRKLLAVKRRILGVSSDYLNLE